MHSSANKAQSKKVFLGVSSVVKMSMSQGKINSNDTMNKQRQTFCLMLLMFKILSVRYSAWDSFGVNF